MLSLAANAAVADGKIVVVAAGNSGDAPDTIAAPGAAADAITVGAASEWSAAPRRREPFGRHLSRPFLEPRRRHVRGDMKPDIVAPGVTIQAANANTGDGYIVHSGTSMATPFVAGSAALTLQAAPAWSSDEVQAAMEATAEDFGSPGKDEDWGAGLLDVLALTARGEGQTRSDPVPTRTRTCRESCPTVANGRTAFDVSAADLRRPDRGVDRDRRGVGVPVLVPRLRMPRRPMVARPGRRARRPGRRSGSR